MHQGRSVNDLDSEFRVLPASGLLEEDGSPTQLSYRRPALRLAAAPPATASAWRPRRRPGDRGGRAVDDHAAQQNWSHFNAVCYEWLYCPFM